jgi:hypothetical protein
MRLKILRRLAVGATLFAAAGCGGANGPSPSTTSVVTTSVTTSAATTSTTTSAAPTTTTTPATTTSTATSTSTTTSTTQSSIPSTTTIPTPSLTFAVNTSPCGLTQVNATLVGACSFTATANFPASNYQFTVGGVSFTPGSATLASGWSVNCGVLGSANSGTQAINVMAGVSASATNTNTGQTVTATAQQILFSKPAGAC